MILINKKILYTYRSNDNDVNWNLFRRKMFRERNKFSVQ